MKTRVAEEPKTLTNSIGLEMVLISAGSFMMGFDGGDDGGDGYEDDVPVHKVTISQPFYLGKYVVTQKQWEAVMGNNPSKFKGRDNPVENVSRDDVLEFIKRLNEKEGTTGYRLPTEAEWEYAARAGSRTAWFFGDDEDELSLYAWFDGNSSGQTHPVGQKQPNPWGLYDIYGNVCELVEDWYGPNYYAYSPENDPKGPSEGSLPVLRGGSWADYASISRSAARNHCWLNSRGNCIGFRLAFSPGQ